MKPAVLIGVIALVAVQPRPDFSGRWTIDPAAGRSAAAPPAASQQPPGRRGGGPPAVPGDMGSGWGSTITIGQTASTLTVEYAFFTRGDLQPPLRFTFALDGSETKNTVMMGRGFQVERSTVAWDAQALVVTTLHDFFDPAGKPATVSVTRRLTLESPDTLVIDTTRGGALGGPPSTTRAVYRRAVAGG